MEFLIIWLLVSVEKIATVFALGGKLMTLSVLFFLATYVYSFILSDSSEKMKTNLLSTRKARNRAKFAWVVGLIFSLISVILPSKQEVAIIVGGGYTYKAVTSKEAKDFGGKAVEMIMNHVETALEDGKSNKIQKKVLENEK